MKFIIKGQHKLKGEIPIKGAKNAALKIIPAALLSRQKITIANLPQVEDVFKSLEIAKQLGAKIKREKDVCEIEAAEISKNKIDPRLFSSFRGSIMFAGPILARIGEIKFPHPGGCVIGASARPINLFLDGFKAFGAEVKIKDGCYHLKAKKLKSAKYFFTNMTVTGTESLMLAATLAEGVTVLKNCAMEPEIKALADYLNLQGAQIKGAGSPTIMIKGVKALNAGQFNIIPDRITTGTFAIMSAITKSNITITHCNPSHIEALLEIFKKQGIKFKAGSDWLEVKSTAKIKPYSIKTHEYPGFPTDLQSPFTVLATQAQGSSLIHETIYDQRLLFTDTLRQMGADLIMYDPHRVLIKGPSKLFGKKIISPDLRAGISLVLAGLIAEGETQIDNIYQIDRGYEDIDGRLRALGAEIKRVK